MIIEINKNIDNYKDSVVLGMTAKQLIFSVLSIVAGGGIVLLLYRYVGLTTSTYIAIPIVAPIALSGFYSYNGMSFMEMMKLKIHFAFGNCPLTYVSTESEAVIQKLRLEENSQGKKNQKNSTEKGEKSAGSAEKLQKVKKKMIWMLSYTILLLVAFALFVVWYKT